MSLGDDDRVFSESQAGRFPGHRVLPVPKERHIPSSRKGEMFPVRSISCPYGSDGSPPAVTTGDPKRGNPFRRGGRRRNGLSEGDERFGGPDGDGVPSKSVDRYSDRGRYIFVHRPGKRDQSAATRRSGSTTLRRDAPDRDAVR